MSNINIKPLNAKLIVHPDPRKEKTDSGLYIPENAKQNYVDLQWGTVKRVSGKVPEIKEGDRVMYLATAGKEQEFNGTKYLILDDRDIWGVEVPEGVNNQL